MAESSKGVCNLQARESKIGQMEFSRKFEVCVCVCVAHEHSRSNIGPAHSCIEQQSKTAINVNHDIILKSVKSE